MADGSVEILRRLGPDPTRDDFRELYRSARDGSMVEALAEIAPPPAEIGNIVLHQLVWGEFSSRRDAVGALRALFRCGSKWAVATPTEVADVRRQLLKAGDYRFVELMRLLSEGENCSPAILAELVRTPTIRERMRQVGFLRQETPLRRGYPPERPTGTAKVLKKCGIVEPKHEWLPHSVTIGSGMGACERLKLTREEFYKLIWSEPVDVLARRWGVSGRGLGKTCARFKVPTPPRGYWARVRNGQRVARTPLPRVPAGTLQEVVVLVPSRRDPRASAHPAGHAEQPMGD